MPEFKTLKIDKILVPERLRQVEEDHALAVQASIQEHGLINPITVRKTPAAERPYTLVAGAHRLRAMELLDEDEIDAVIVDADKAEAQLLEISENLFRNELSALDRAIFVQTYRDVWEEKYGKIAKGRPGNRINVIQLLADEASAGFSAHVAERLGISVPTVKRAQSIAQKLSPELRTIIRGTPVADNQSQLLKLSQMEPSRQKKVAVAFGKTADIALAVAATDPHARPKAQQSAHARHLSRLLDTWERAGDQAKADFLAAIGAKMVKNRDKLPSVSEMVAGTEVA